MVGFSRLLSVGFKCSGVLPTTQHAQLPAVPGIHLQFR